MDQLTIIQNECTRLLLENRELRSRMTLNEYQAMASTTASTPNIFMQNSSGEFIPAPYLYPGIGLGEAGEVQNKIKKIARDYDGIVTEQMRVLIKAELGDLLWYVAETARSIGVTLDDVGRFNIERLADRKRRGMIHGSGDNR